VNRLRLLPRAVTAAALFFAVGCNSGGGMSQLTINEQNAEALAAQGVGAVTMLEDMSGMLDSFSGYIDPAAQVNPCPDGGNTVLSINDMMPAGLSTGDYVNLDFNGCTQSGLTLNGMVHLGATDISGNPLDPAGGMREFYGSFDAMTVTFLGATVVIDGGLTASLSSPDSVTFTSVISGSHFSAFAKAGNQAFSGSLDDFMVQRSWDSAANTYVLDLDATVYSSQLGGSAVFQTTVPFTGTVDDHPSVGTFVATGAMGGKITLTAIDNVNVQILVDADGDGVNETTITTTWDALDNNS